MDISAKLDEALNFIETARAELEQGNVVVLDGFQDEIRELCVAMETLPVTDMQKYSEKLNMLGTNLQTLEEELKNQQGLVQSEIMELNHKQKALKSYETASYSDKKDGQ